MILERRLISIILQMERLDKNSSRNSIDRMKLLTIEQTMQNLLLGEKYLILDNKMIKQSYANNTLKPKTFRLKNKVFLSSNSKKSFNYLNKQVALKSSIKEMLKQIIRLRICRSFIGSQIKDLCLQMFSSITMHRRNNMSN